LRLPPTAIQQKFNVFRSLAANITAALPVGRFQKFKKDTKAEDELYLLCKNGHNLTKGKCLAAVTAGAISMWPDFSCHISVA